MEQVGRIIEEKNGLAKVQVFRKSACGGDCGKCMGCPSTGITVEAKDSMGASIGDYVEIASDTQYLNKAVIWVYVIPLIALFMGFAAGTIIQGWFGWKNNQELLQLASGLAFMGATYVFVNRMDRRRRCGFEIVKIMSR